MMPRPQFNNSGAKAPNQHQHQHQHQQQQQHQLLLQQLLLQANQTSPPTPPTSTPTLLATDNNSKYLWSQYEKATAGAISNLNELNPLSLALLISLTSGDALKLFQNNGLLPAPLNSCFINNSPQHINSYANNHLNQQSSYIAQQQQQFENRQPQQLNNNNNSELPTTTNLTTISSFNNSNNLNPNSHSNNIHHHHHHTSQQQQQQLPTPPSSYKAHPPSAPASSLLAKLSAVTSRLNSSSVITTKLDYRHIELFEGFYIVNDNPEPAAIEMIAKRICVRADVISDWFDQKRLKLNPQAGPRSPPAKKRAGGRVVTFSEYQRQLLESIFEDNNYLHPQEYEELSNLIQVPSRNIKIWFKNRRSKARLSGRGNV